MDDEMRAVFVVVWNGVNEEAGVVSGYLRLSSPSLYLNATMQQYAYCQNHQAFSNLQRLDEFCWS